MLKQLFSAPERLFRIAKQTEGRLSSSRYSVNYAPILHNGARIVGLDGPKRFPLAVETDTPTWSYALSFPLDPLGSLSARSVVVLDLEVRAGAVGIGCVADYSSYVDREVVVSTGLRHKVYIPMGSPLAAHHLMFRNVSRAGRSVVRVYGIETSGEVGPDDVA